MPFVAPGAAMLPVHAWGACTTTANVTTCTGTTNLGTTPIGNGPSGPDNAVVTLSPGATVSAGDASAISLRDGANITVNSNATVTSAARSGNGLWNAGKNTIEFRSNGTLTVGAGATVSATGTSTNAEAVNLLGAGNTVVNYGTISGINSAAVWFEDTVIGAANTIDNYGVIRTGNGSDQSIIANVIGSQHNGDVHFTNRTGAVVYGGLSFASGNDVLTLYPSSVVTGGFNGGGGTNTLTLAGEAGSSDTLTGGISNFQMLTKTGPGTWTLQGSVGNNGGNAALAVDVQQGTLALTGNNANFNGTVVVDPAGTLEARAQSLPPSVTDNGLVRFVQPDNGNYAGAIGGSGSVSKTAAGLLTLSGTNSYQGGTLIQGGTVAVDADVRLGAGSGSLTLDGGALELTSSFDLSAARAIALTANNGTIQTDAGVASTVSQAIGGAGALTKAGAGLLTLANDNGYGGGTTIGGGTLQLGNGGTSGSIVGNVTDNGTLVFNRSDSVTFGGAVSGSGAVTQAGPGVTVLTADNSYTGATTISNGWLYVDGNQTGATGATTAAAGTRLGGNGTLGGSVTIADGATLAPGAVPTAPATLTINGDLNLNATSNLFYNMVEANVAGGQLNDLTDVNGNLVLDGVINVADQGQTLGAGVYRVINYTGTLTNNGLTIGSYMTAPATPQDTPTTVGPLTNFSVQTSIPGQVNLVNTAGLSLNYWDGDAGPKDNNVIDGGNGVWQGTAGNDNWTDPNGAVNAAWANDSYAIFMATPGTVRVDDSTAGQVTTTGMQFASDGYLVTGDPITLLNASTGNLVTVRVGDGTPAGAAMTATIDSVLAGNAALIKDDLGTLVLDGVNTYTNGTGIFGGTLQVSSDQNLGAANGALAIANGATLNTTGTFATGRPILLGSSGIGTSGGTIETAPGTTLSVSGPIIENPSGPPATLAKTGDGTLVITGDGNTYTGGTTIGAGTLQLGNGGATGSIPGDVVDNGRLVFDRSDTFAFGGAVSGIGSLTQAGAGTTVLTNGNTYTGGTTIATGTLQLGNGGTTGSIVGDVTDDGTLAFNRSDTVSFDGVVSGSGSLDQAGAGTTVLTNTNSYLGGTTIGAGTLQLGNGGTTGSIVGDVADNGTLAFNRSDTVRFDGAVSGAGSLSQIGTGTTVLTNDNTYTGGTTISAGALQIGNGGATGSIAGDVTDNGALIFDRLDDLTYDGRIIGSGLVVKQGPGTAVFTGGSTYSGGTTISAGTLQLGNGGSGGSIVGDIVDNGTLAIDHSDVLPVVGNVSGTGNVVQRGTGATVLLGTNSYSGPTDVASGALYVDGDQTAATGLSTAASGGTLGGSGTIGGDVTIASGGALAPGQVGIAPGTLTINGNLNLNGGSILNYGFGQANVVGGPLNDLTVVQGNLTLAGTLNVQTTEGGTFDPGLYRVISYAGALANEGLAIGTIPSPDYFVQTSVNHQVNLVNTAGMVFSYWDGVAGPKDNGLIDGGNGSWQNSGGNNNWTNELGVPNAPFADSTFAIFTAAPGTVTVDDSLGTVSAAGMQFASDGYVLAGAPVTLVGSAATPGESIIRVGDGTAPGAGYVATIDSVLAGDVRLVKSDLGTLVLNGANAYTGGSQVNGGVLQVHNDGNLGAAGGALGLDGGTLRTTGTFATARATTLGDNGGTFEPLAGTTLTLDSGIGGTGVLTKAGAGTLVFAADNTYTNRTEITGGTLQVGNGGTAGSIVGNVIDDGVLAFDRADTYTYGGNVWGGGALEQTGSGTTVITGGNTYTGPTLVAAGTLRAGATATFSPASAFAVNPGATLDLNGFDQTVAGLANAGLVRMGGAPGTTLRVAGNYVGMGGTLALNTYLGGDGAPSDRPVADGGTAWGGAATGAPVAASRAVVKQAATGSTSILVNNVGGPGAPTSADGILVVDAVNGATTTPGAFSLGAPAVAGPYEYSLYRGGAAGGTPENWFLRSALDCAAAPGVPACQPTPPTPPGPPGPPAPTPSVPVYRPETSLYTAIPSLALTWGAALLDSLHERMGGQIAPQPGGDAGGGQSPPSNVLGWARIIGITGTQDGGAGGIYGKDGPGYDYSLYAAQAGMDVYRSQRPDNSADHAGFYVAYGEIDGDVDHFDGSGAGTDRLDGATLGAYWTHFGTTGWYVDNVVQGTRYHVKASGPTGSLDSQGSGLGASVEGGYPLALANGLTIEPQAQLVYQTIHLNGTHDDAADVRFNDAESLTARLGVRVSRSWELAPGAAGSAPRKATAWVRASFVNEFLGHPETQFSSADGYVPFRANIHGPGGKLDAGVDAQVTKRTSMYGSVQGQFTGAGHAVGAEVGVKVRF